MREKEMLAETCMLMADLLGKLKDEGKISETEYEEHTKMKELFLQVTGTPVLDVKPVPSLLTRYPGS